MSVRLGMLGYCVLASSIMLRRSGRTGSRCRAGPGLASGWPWKQNAGRSVRASPCSDAVEQRDVRRRAVRGQRRRIHGEAVVLAGDHHAAGVEILHRMVGAVVAELHLHGLRAGGEAQQLVAEADAEHRHAACVEDLADRLDRVVARLRIARDRWTGTRRRASCASTSLRWGLRGHHRHAAAAVGQHAQDVALDAVVVGDDVEARRRRRCVALAQLPTRPSFQS